MGEKMDLNVFSFIACIVLCFQFQVSYCGYDSYRAAVVEFNPVSEGTDSEKLAKNLEHYEELIEEASDLGADIIVFPEGGLTKSVLSEVPHPSEKAVPCQNVNSSLLKNLSCAAKSHRIYLVVNLPEERKIPGPSQEVTVQYNTNVVFDREGEVIARYAKYNLFDEPKTNRPPEPELSVFKTDFGVTFGTFICFDILFQEPTLRLVKQFKISNFVFTTRWFSELPFLTAIQAQQGWAEVNNVNLLASGYNSPKEGSTGSGIFNGKFGSLVHYMGKKSVSKLLMAEVPLLEDRNLVVQPKKERIFHGSLTKDLKRNTNNLLVDDFALLSDQIELFESQKIESGVDFETELCSHKNFCCKFNVRMDKLSEKSTEYNYRAVVFNGVRKFGLNATGGVQVCGVVFCNGPKLSNCTKRGTTKEKLFEFSELRIEGNFKAKNSLQIPTTLVEDTADLNTLLPSKYDFKVEEHEGRNHINMNLEWPVDNLLTFGIWGRNFVTDGKSPSLPNSKASQDVPIFFALALTSLLCVYNNVN